MKRFASDNQLSTWLGELGEPGVAVLRRVLREFVRRLLAQCPAGAVRSGGELEVFFDDTQIEVTGRRFQGAAFNYEGNLALGLQALFVGPFLADQRVTDDNTAVSALLPELLRDNAPLWQDAQAYVFADSASSEE